MTFSGLSEVERRRRHAGRGRAGRDRHLWLAEDGLPRRLELIAEPGDIAALNGAGLTILVEPYDDNAPVAVEVPGAASVIDGGAALGGTDPTERLKSMEMTPNVP
ncbi:MAG TPA: hypothetical protein VKA65_09490 [Acidimicrobiales bacterium]|nr:hypothetical protein [Acidimicrobiales bacterium]